MADDAGALLVRSGLVSSSALDDARARVEGLGGTLGEQLVASGAVTDDALTDFYKKRLLVPQVNPNTLARLPAKVVAAIPSTMAIELRAIPVSLDADNNLTIAMSDPSDRHAVDEIAGVTGSYVVRAVATQMQIAWCLAHYYGHVTHLGQRLLRAEEEANATADLSSTPAAGRPARTKGITGEINASRKRAIVPGELEARSGELEARSGEIEVKKTTRDTVPELPVVTPEPLDDEPIEPPKPRPRSISGEIRVPGRRAPSIKPPLPDDSGQLDVPDIDSGPVISIEPSSETTAPVAEPSVVDASGPVITMEAEDGGAYEPEIQIQPASEDLTDRTRLPVPKRKRPAEPDPPELAARAGEVQLATGSPIKKISFDEPRIIIADDLVDEPRGNASGAVSGEVRSRPAMADVLPEQTESIFVELGGEDDDDVPAIIHDPAVDQSGPVLLDRPRAASAPVASALEDAPTNISGAPAIIEDEPSDVVVLDARKAPPAAGPRHRNTVVGIGAVTATTRARLFDAENSSGVPSDELDDQPTGSRTAPHLDNDPTRVDAYAAPAREDDTSDELLAAPPGPYEGRDTSQIAAVPAPSKAVPGPSGQIRLDRVKRAPSRHDDDEDEDDALDEVTKGKPTMVMSAVELDDVIPGRTSQIIPAHLVQTARSGEIGARGTANTGGGKRVDYDPVDDGWGPPGTTIPPPLLGAIPGSDLSETSGVIPIPDMDSAPLIVAPPVPPQAGIARPRTASGAGISRALEQATARVLELIHTLDHTTERDQVVAVMIAHLAETHQRAGFFAVRGGVLTLFAITPRVPSMPNAALRLDRPSTLQDVVGTRLPYRGPMLDEASQLFLNATLGACPSEILLVPVSVRERVVGVLFGDNRSKHTFDDQLALAARAAGMAFERILNAKRGDG